ncbi:tRNA pseudouridine(55) synthase TruB [Candidatus Nitrotoga sp. AM1P]|uniref:tRNA pseudouridine(55) synthase TruB n=1 Tax=Candidatus Nitrotoga sp. AM1P TaxID=2559597 RepID=UPI0010B818C1|nr:tRNA pseudouridine(55) synthase TruB [Candidatus Nitrotoga sp. AM1P]BBJ23225.1 tRNA pseudouridine synthase B [Candidatus Nitrotoga sp. AM1P]
MTRIMRSLDGVLLFDKPLGLSSNIALQKVRRLFEAEKAGHTGTLDPLATGLLPVCFGEATKFTSSLLEADKTYCALIRLGQTTTTGDAEGEITNTYAVELDQAQVCAVLRSFIGEIQQMPPMHSAIKHQGKPLYEYIRKGETVIRASRSVIIHELILERFAGDEMEITVRCSKGTYVRTLAEDIGLALGCGAHLQGLRRTAIGRFGLESAHNLAQMESVSMLEREAYMLPLDSLLQDLPVLDLDAVQVTRIAQGQRLVIEAALLDGKVRLYGAGSFIGVADLMEQRLTPVRLLSSVAKSAACIELGCGSIKGISDRDA